MAGFENHAGFTITGSKLQVVEVVYKADQFVLENVDEAYFNEPVDLNNDKETKISALLQGAFNELQIKHPLKSTSVSFTLPFDLFYTMQVPYDNTLLPQDLIEEFRWELSILYPYLSVKDLVIQYIEVDRNNLIAHNSAMVVAVPRKFLFMLHTFCNQNNLKLKFADNIHIASDRALSVSSPLMEKGLILSVYFSTKFLSLIFSSNGKPVYLKVIPLNDAGEITERLNNELSAEGSSGITKSMIDAAFITGEDLSASIVQSLRSSAGIDFIYFNPFEKIKPEPKLFNNKCYSERANSFASAAGITYRLA
ncbi:MAG: hypothetical protein R6W90_05565 [Ignavibacteriaceae bacterium]